MLSEDDIKKSFLPFLKQFYRYRYEYRPESVQTELDNVSDGGLIADGMLSFRKDDGSLFVCTYEATSADKSEEVKFSLNVSYFTWDCLAFGAVTAAVCYAAAFVLRLSWLVSLQWTGNMGFVLGMGLIGFFFWYFTMRNWRKYRYIYAVEQFKQYFAHEQWIALAEDVFPAPTDPYLQELKQQCVYNGFGLALVPDAGEVRVLATPSRLGIYGKDRQMVHWVTRMQWYQAMSQNVAVVSRFRPAVPNELTLAWNKIWRPVRYLLLEPAKKAFGTSLGRTNTAFDRYMRGHGVQKWVFMLALAAILPLAYRVLTVREDKIEDVVEWPERNPEDQYGYLYEGESARDPRAIPRQDPEPVRADTIQTIDLSGNKNQDEVPTINLSGDEPEDKPSAAEKADPCASVRRKKGWIIQDNSFSGLAFADERAAALRRQGIESEVLAIKCLGDESSGYIVRLGGIFTTEAAAERHAANFTKALERYGLLQSALFVRRIN